MSLFWVFCIRYVTSRRLVYGESGKWIRFVELIERRTSRLNYPEGVGRHIFILTSTYLIQTIFTGY
jgi:hypothetical protein